VKNKKSKGKHRYVCKKCKVTFEKKSVLASKEKITLVLYWTM